MIMAHELCHHVKNHIWKSLALQAVLASFSFYAAYRLLPPYLRFGFRGVADIANFPLLALLFMLLSLLVLPIVNFFSRRLETEADEYALDLTGDALGFVSSMEKLASLNLANKAPNRIIEFISTAILAWKTGSTWRRTGWARAYRSRGQQCPARSCWRCRANNTGHNIRLWSQPDS